MVRLSKRLQAVASLAGACNTLADVGTDHGYIPVYLVGCKRAKRAVAMDINPGPLRRAQEHIAAYGLQKLIETRLSDGMAALQAGEADKIVVAGMGGNLMQRILEQGEAAARAAQGLVLQPQSEIGAFRKFLWEHGYGIVKEDMVCEDGKYYPMVLAKHIGEAEPLGRVECKFGPALLRERHPVLKEYLEWQRNMREGVLARVKGEARGDVGERVRELEEELGDIEEALGRFY